VRATGVGRALVGNLGEVVATRASIFIAREGSAA